MDSPPNTLRIAAAVLIVILVSSSVFIAPGLLYHNHDFTKIIDIKDASVIVPVTLWNNQSSATPDPFNEEIKVNSAIYENYEAPNLQNVFWVTSDNVNIPSWIQSGNSRTSLSTVYWLKLPFSIRSDSNATIQMCFDPLNVSLFSVNGDVGEFPGATQVYGQFDNGANVFPFYDNFSGTALNHNKWNVVFNNSGASYLVDNGLTVTGVAGNAYVSVVTTQKFEGTYEAFLENTGTNSWAGSGIFLGVESPRASGGDYGFMDGYRFFVTDNRPGSGFGSYITLVDNGVVSQLNYTSYQETTNTLMKINWTGHNLSWAEGNSTILTTSNTNFTDQPVYLDIWVGGDLTNTESATYQYVRIVTLLPNNVMPSSSMGDFSHIKIP